MDNYLLENKETVLDCKNIGSMDDANPSSPKEYVGNNTSLELHESAAGNPKEQYVNNEDQNKDEQFKKLLMRFELVELQIIKEFSPHMIDVAGRLGSKFIDDENKNDFNQLQ